MAFRLKWKEGQDAHFHEAGPKTVEFVNSKLESSDFDNHASKIVVKNEIKYGIPRIKWLEQVRMLAFILVGVITGILGAFIIICYERGVHIKYHLLVEQFNKLWNSPLYPTLCLLLLAFMIVPALIGTALCVYIEPKAAGGGLAPVIAYVNGVKVPGALACKTLIVKTFSLICCMIAGLAAGMEAPMVHVGACVACSLVNLRIPFTDIQPFESLHTDVERRDLVGAGIAAGIVGAFSTPVGGCLMALEEGITFYNARLLFRILVSAVSCALTLNFLLSLDSNCVGCLSQQHLLFFFVVREHSDMLFYAYEFPFYVLTGIVGGVMGSLFNLIQIRLIILRKRYVTKKWQQLLEMVIIVVLTCSFFLTLIFSTEGYCTPKMLDHRDDDVTKKAHYGCQNGTEIATSGLFVFQTIPNVIRMLFSEELVGEIPLIVYLSGIFLLSVFTMGSLIASGVFIPHLVIGAAWGRLFGEVLRKFTGWKWVQPEKYAFIASGAQLVGCVRVPFTVGVLMMEASGSPKMGFAVFIAVITSFLVASLFNESIYHHQWSMAGIPCVNTDPPPFCSQITAQELMSEPPVTLMKKMSVESLRNTLKSTTHNCFPITTNTGILEGSISRGLLIVLIKKQRFVGSAVSEDEAEILGREFLSAQNLQMIESAPGEKIVDLELYMDPTPIAVTKITSFDSVYRLVSCLGLRHIIVVDSGYKVVGVITRKKLSAYRLHVNLIHASITKYQIK
ncbi:Hypothetical protein NTJ_12783 [Nesidiocoris tenuis]|uniref:Chloride channel protein n=1 Tax=Nesidiocoris tenuis TaxID=355587 RepID=A0ABN7B6E3_9HEMI|nr:Hypothetical protein NTJ_12783 [Nesidiocoris tenuis]